MGEARPPDADDARPAALPPDREAGAVQLIDSHAHLLHLREGRSPEDALGAARAAGVRAVLNIGDDDTDNQPGIALTERIPGLRTTAGWHPHAAGGPLTSERLHGLRRLVEHPHVVAVGEIGLDYHFTEHHRVPEASQKRAFRQMLGLSQEVGKPVVLHTRDAFPDLFAILDEFPGVRGVFHCFSGNAAFATEAVARGFFVSFAATVTYPGTHGIQGAACVTPLHAMLVETDAPFLPPQSMRGKPNAPEFLGETVERIAALCGVPAAEVAAATARNATALFGLPVSD
ncbi:MAG TPA: TatD family hydrolase [Candidatus Limnocylindrales bacterium]|nr:TatD family hydrolase [Candidatus Limnocylindrales bacterium]